jgi:hypothetical protein
MYKKKHNSKYENLPRFFSVCSRLFSADDDEKNFRPTFFFATTEDPVKIQFHNICCSVVVVVVVVTNCVVLKMKMNFLLRLRTAMSSG